MRLVARDGTVAVGPGRPLLREVLEQQFGECLAVVGERRKGCGVQQLRQMVLQPIAAPLLKLLEQAGRPVAFGHFVAVVEEGVGVRGMRAVEGIADVTEVVGHGLSVEVVDDQPFATGCSALHAHDAIFNIKGNDFLLRCLIAEQGLLLFGGFPGEETVVCAISNVDSHSVAAIEHHLLQNAVLAILFIGENVEMGDAVARERLFNKHRPAGRFLQRHPRSAERPARARSHVDLDAVALRFGHDEAQHLHVAVGEKGNVVSVVALHAVDGGNLHRTGPGTAVLLQVPAQVILVDSRAQPPPAQSGSCFGFGFWPLLCLHGEAEGQQQAKG